MDLSYYEIRKLLQIFLIAVVMATIGAVASLVLLYISGQAGWTWPAVVFAFAFAATLARMLVMRRQLTRAKYFTPEARLGQVKAGLPEVVAQLTDFSIWHFLGVAGLILIKRFNFSLKGPGGSGPRWTLSIGPASQDENAESDGNAPSEEEESTDGSS